MQRHLVRILAPAALLILLTAQLLAADWPAYRHDNQRSGVTGEKLALPLAEQWTFQAIYPPNPAWPDDPAWMNPFTTALRARGAFRALLTFDRAMHPVAAGGSVYFGSSADHKVYCLDASTGAIKWVFFTEGPVRMAPEIVGGRLYVGSDGGYVYCLDAPSGKLLWKYRPGPEEARLPANEQIASRWPVRSSVVVDGNVAYCAAGLLEGAYLAAIDAATGKELWKHSINQIAEGYLVLSKQHVVVPAGKASPLAYDRNGKELFSLGPHVGPTAMLVGDWLISGPGWWGNQMGVIEANKTGSFLAELPANHLVASPTAFYLLSGEGSSAVLISGDRRFVDLRRLINRKNRLAQEHRKLAAGSPEAKHFDHQMAVLDAEIDNLSKKIGDVKKWEQPCKHPHALILSGDTLFAGGDGEVAAYGTADGKLLWTGKVTGNAYGLAVSDGRLLVSTDKGTIHCFGGGGGGRRVVKPGSADPYPRDALSGLYAAAARKIVADTPFDKGYALVLGCGEGRLACEIAKSTHLTVVGVESDPGKVAAARAAVDKAGLYGGRVVIHQAPLDKLPYTKYMFNLIVSDQTLAGGELPPSAAEVYRLLRPCGGVLYIGQPGQQRRGELTKARLEEWLKSGSIEAGSVADAADGLWAVAHRGKLPGAGEWSHQWANIANTDCSEDQAFKKPFQLQWYGRPGPKYMLDRHSITHAPVSVNGRIFCIGNKEAVGKNDGVMFGQDAYNGTLLWMASLPEFQSRVNVPRDSGYLTADQTHVFLACDDKCLCLKADTGQQEAPYTLPQTSGTGKYEYKWAYVGVTDDLLFGSGARKGSFYRHGRRPWYDRPYLEKSNSDFLFAYGKKDRKLKWKYEGVIVGPSISGGGERIYFLEQRDEALLQSPGRLIAEGKKLAVVALDMNTGRKLWEKPFVLDDNSSIFWFCYKDEILTISTCGWKGAYGILALNAANGQQMWKQGHQPLAYHHGAHRRKTVIVGQTLLLEPAAYDLKTGQPKWKMEGRINCGNLSASAYYLFGRDHRHRLYDISVLEKSGPSTAAEDLTPWTRPGCNVNMITAGGLLLTPEASAGCWCWYPVRTSMGFVSK